MDEGPARHGAHLFRVNLFPKAGLGDRGVGGPRPDAERGLRRQRSPDPDFAARPGAVDERASGVAGRPVGRPRPLLSAERGGDVADRLRPEEAARPGGGGERYRRRARTRLAERSGRPAGVDAAIGYGLSSSTSSKGPSASATSVSRRVPGPRSSWTSLTLRFVLCIRSCHPWVGLPAGSPTQGWQERMHSTNLSVSEVQEDRGPWTRRETEVALALGPFELVLLERP